jgi:hypothetical protein
MEMPEETYLGDGLYVVFDGGGVRLRVSGEDGDDVVYLKRDALAAFLLWLTSLPEQEQLTLRSRLPS